MISILMPVYNRVHIVIETLRSIKNQSYKDWECIIVDDGSTDNTREVIQQFVMQDSRFKLYDRPLNHKKGPSGCRNYAFQLSQGEYIQFFDSDDIMHPDHLMKKQEAFQQSKVDFTICKLKSFTVNDKDFNFYDDDIPNFKIENSLFESFVTGSFPMMMQMPMWKKNVLKEVMPFREDIQLLEDHELYVRILASERKVGIINEVLVLYRMGENSITDNFFNNISSGIDSVLKVKKSVIKFSDGNNEKIKLSLLKQILAFIRTGLVQKQYLSAEKCFRFIYDEKLAYNFKLNMKVLRIHFFYYIFKLIKRGDTKFKSLLKL